MALYWDFDRDFVGTVTEKNGNICNLYTGNALAIMVSETEEEYGLHWFAADEQHLKNMLAHDACKADIAGLKFTLKNDVLRQPKVKTLIKLLTGNAHITLCAPGEVVERKIYKISSSEKKED